MHFIKFIFLSTLAGLIMAFSFLAYKGELPIQGYFKQPIHNSNDLHQISFSKAVNRAKKAVVTVYTQRLTSSTAANNKNMVQTSLGSGVVLTPSGIIITNHHVIDNADNILVHFPDGKSASAVLIGYDRDSDLAVLQVPFRNLNKIDVHSSNNIDVGDIVLAIGNPLNIGQTVTMGIISATGRNRVGINTYENFIQTDASINPGNSGGALINSKGEIIGINTAIFTQSGGSNGIGFAIPINIALDIARQIIKNGSVSRGWFGVEGAEVAVGSGLGSKSVVMITQVFESSPAFMAGLLKNDVLTEINGQTIKNIRDVVDQVASFKPGTSVSVTVDRNAVLKSFTIKITKRPTN